MKITQITEKASSRYLEDEFIGQIIFPFIILKLILTLIFINFFVSEYGFLD
jgi:hypothetical protein